MAAKQQFVYNLPFNIEQRTRDIFILLHTNQPSTAGLYNVETSPSAILVETLYDLVIRDRDDLKDKNPDANSNILPLMFALSTFFRRVPRDVGFYLVLLWYYGLFTPEWLLPGKQREHSSEDRDQTIEPGDLAAALAALGGSTIEEEWTRLMQVLVEYD